MAQVRRLEVTIPSAFDPKIDPALAMVGFGFNPGERSGTCWGEAGRLQSKSGAELRMMGIRRDQIAAHMVQATCPRVPI
ncbi:hypothetical protein [Pseudoruegeria sp. SK021]|uniref:hypothetical protein n=1 Tax=Pseudoruegeria sp. SK021 TaxID=1933035 RepID=UPI000A25E7B5|nr:hypothetical protein [Pseudoruegeria sp. SK021]OSP55247.1 hypothetical protein BV911_08445 [Pseudoruegeria sp. SK021]